MPLIEAQYVPNGRTIVKAFTFDDLGSTAITRDVNGRILFVGNLTTTPVEVLVWDTSTNLITLASPILLSPNLSSPVVSGTVTGTYTLGGNGTIALTNAGPYTIAGTSGVPGSFFGAMYLGFGTDFTTGATGGFDSAFLFITPNSVRPTSGTGNIYGVFFGPTSLNPTGASDTGAGVTFAPPVKGGAGTFTHLATVNIGGAPSSGASNLYSLRSQAGNVRFNSGSLLMNTGVTSGVGTGSIVLGNGQALRWVKFDGSTTLEILRLSVSDVIVIGGGGSIVSVGEPLSTTGASGGDLVLPNARNVRITNQNGNNTTPITTITLKSGSGAGDYTTSSATYVDVDATNLGFSVTIPIGFKLLVNATCAIKHSTLASTIGLALFDGAVVAEEVIEAAVAGDREHMGLTHAITGDDAAHTVKLQWKTSAATATMNNASSTLNPRMTFFMAPST